MVPVTLTVIMIVTLHCLGESATKKKDHKEPEKKEVVQQITDLSELSKCGASSTLKVSVDLSQLTSSVEYVW